MLCRSRTSSLCVLPLLAALAACGDSEIAAPNADPNAFVSEVSPDGVTLTTGLTLAVGGYASVSGCQYNLGYVKFKSLNTAIASVTSAGSVKGLAQGNTKVTAIRCSVSSSTLRIWTDTLPVTVTAPAPADAAAPAPSNTVLAELPRSYVQVGDVPAVTGNTIRVAAGQSLQAALDAAQPGDHILLAPGGVWRGNFILRKKTTSSNWIVIRPDLSLSSLPPAGTRMTPSKAAALKLPRIETATVSPVLRTELGSQRYRVIGVEMTGVKTSISEIYHLTSIGDGSTAQSSEASAAKYIVFDRVYVHGNYAAGFQVRRCIALHGSHDAVVDSWVSECTHKGVDAQAIWGWNGPGPHRITNNYLEASGENVGFGGATPGIFGVVPSDIEIRDNHIVKPLSWKGSGLVIKNHIEFKNAQRVLIEGNMIEGLWQAAQQGYSLVFTPGGEGGKCNWCTVRDVTVRYNHIRRAGGGINVSANPHGEATPAGRITVRHNIFDSLGVGSYTGTARPIMIGTGELFDTFIEHNTAISKSSYGTGIVVTGIGQKRLTVRNNLILGLYGILGDQGKSQGVPSLDYGAPGWTWAGNLHVGVSSMQLKYYPTNNFYASTTGIAGMANFAAGDYTLTSASPYKGKGTDGLDPGAGIATVRSKLDGVIVSR